MIEAIEFTRYERLISSVGSPIGSLGCAMAVELDCARDFLGGTSALPWRISCTTTSHISLAHALLCASGPAMNFPFRARWIIILIRISGVTLLLWIICLHHLDKRIREHDLEHEGEKMWICEKVVHTHAQPDHPALEGSAHPAYNWIIRVGLGTTQNHESEDFSPPKLMKL